MQSGYSSKITELQEVIRDIKSRELALERIERIAKRHKNDNLLQERDNIEKNINELKVKKDKLNEELIDSEDFSENTRMKYAIMLLLNFGNEELGYCL